MIVTLRTTLAAPKIEGGRLVGNYLGYAGEEIDLPKSLANELIAAGCAVTPDAEDASRRARASAKKKAREDLKKLNASKSKRRRPAAASTEGEDGDQKDDRAGGEASGDGGAPPASETGGD